MGKKSRKKKGAAALASDIDNTICAHCGDDAVDPFHWDHASFKILECCGGSLCCKCLQTRRQKRSDVADRIGQDPFELYIMYRDAFGPCTSCGKPAVKSVTEAVARFTRLANAGHSHSQHSLAVCYKYGGRLGVQKDAKLAVKWFRNAAEQGHLTACAQLGEHFRFGAGVEKSYAEAKRWYELGGNHAMALLGMGDLYRYADGVEQDVTAALEFYQKSADQGYPLGLLSYGDLLLELGRTEEALAQYETGASLENQVMGNFLSTIAKCQLKTAHCLDIMHDGKDIQGDAGKDPIPRMLFWARRAARNGNEEASDYLSELEDCAHAECRHCEKPFPRMKCSKCQGASYCDRSCQKKAWKAGHKSVCNGLPKIVSRDDFLSGMYK